MATIELNDAQASAILVEGLARQLYENGGKIPDDPAVRMEDAIKLTNAALAARNAGNKSENVEAILFIAQVDQRPLAQSSHEEMPLAGLGAIISLENESNMHNGLDLASLSDGVIEGLIVGLDKYPPSEQVEADRAAFVGERERRKNAQAQKGQEDPQAEAPGEASQSPSEIAGEVTGTAGESLSQTNEQIPADSSGESADGDASAGASVQGEDAGAFARAQTEEPAQKGRKAKAKPTEEDGERAELEAALTLPMVKAHGVNITKLNDLSTDEFKYIIENPNGPSAKESKMPVDENEIEASAVPKDNNVVGSILPDIPASEKEISKADLGLEVADNEKETSGQVFSERERVESLITGPCLKAYRRGRREIPSIGINELKLMALYPDGKISPDELEKAREIDNLGKEVVEVVREVDTSFRDLAKATKKSQMVVTKEAPGPEVVSHFLEVDPQEEEPQNNQGDAEQFVAVEAELVGREPNVLLSAGRTHNIKDLLKDPQQQNRAMQIIARENMPIPPDYANEEAPIFPIDVSIISRDELFSLHAKFHAYEIRMNYVLMEHEDYMNDCVKLREYREAEVAKSVPFLGEDGKRNTNEFRDAQVKGDKEVLELGEKEHEARKIVTDLKVLRNGYHLDCERLSRQMSKYERERLDAPR